MLYRINLYGILYTKPKKFEQGFYHFFSFLAKENIFAVDYAPSDTGKSLLKAPTLRVL